MWVSVNLNDAADFLSGKYGKRLDKKVRAAAAEITFKKGAPVNLADLERRCYLDKKALNGDGLTVYRGLRIYKYLKVDDKIFTLHRIDFTRYHVYYSIDKVAPAIQQKLL